MNYLSDCSSVEMEDLHNLWQRVLAALPYAAPDMPGYVDFYRTKVLPVSFEDGKLLLGVEDGESLISKYVGVKHYVAHALQSVTGTVCSIESVQVILAPHLFNNSVGLVKDVAAKTLDENKESTAIFEDQRKSLVSAILQSYRFISIPRPVLWWLPIHGPYKSSLYVAARQINYLCGGVSDQMPLEIAISKFVHWSGLNKETVCKLIESKDLRSFVGLVGEKKPKSVLEGGKLKRLSYKFQVAMDIPLLPEMEIKLEEILLSAGIADDTEQALFFTKKAIEENGKLFLPSDNPHPPENWDLWNEGDHTVTGVVTRLAKSIPLSPVSQVLVSELTEMIVPQDLGSVRVPWYRFNFWFPLLGQSVGWFTILLKSLTFYNPETEEKRTSVKSSFEYFASRLQVSARTVKDWFLGPKTIPLPDSSSSSQREYLRFLEATRRKQIPSLLCKFVRIDDESIVRKNNQIISLIFDVEVSETLIPSHLEFVNKICSSGINFDKLDSITKEDFVNAVRGEDSQRIDVLIASLTSVKPHAKPDATSVKPHAKPDATSVKPHAKPDATFIKPHAKPDATFIKPHAKPDDLKDLDLNYLTPEKYYKTNNTSTTPFPLQNKAVAVIPSNISVYSILKKALSNPKKTKAICEDGEVQIKQVISWLLYMAAPRENEVGVGVVAINLGIRPLEYPDKKFVDLASMELDTLKKILDTHIRRGHVSEFSIDSPLMIEVSKKWNACMGKANINKLSDVYRWIFEEE